VIRPTPAPVVKRITVDPLTPCPASDCSAELTPRLHGQVGQISTKNSSIDRQSARRVCSPTSRSALAMLAAAVVLALAVGFRLPSDGAQRPTSPIRVKPSR